MLKKLYPKKFIKSLSYGFFKKIKNFIQKEKFSHTEISVSEKF
jgi:hypothetical protein